MSLCGPVVSLTRDEPRNNVTFSHYIILQRSIKSCVNIDRSVDHVIRAVTQAPQQGRNRKVTQFVTGKSVIRLQRMAISSSKSAIISCVANEVRDGVLRSSGHVHRK